MLLREYLEQVKSGLQIFEDYGLSEQIDFSAEIRPGSQAVLRATVQLGFDNHRHDTDGRIVPAEPPSIEVLVQEIIDCMTR
jgi:hypothetical protein